MTAYTLAGDVTVGYGVENFIGVTVDEVTTSMIYNPTGSAYDTDLTKYTVLDGTISPPDSLLVYAHGQHDGGDGVATLSDSTASFGTDTFNTGFKVINTSDLSEADITNTTNTTVVGTLSGGDANHWDDYDWYYVVVSGYAEGDRIYYSPTASAGVFSWQLYDESDFSFSAVYTATLPAYNGEPWVTLKGVPSIEVDGGQIVGDVTVSIIPSSEMTYNSTSDNHSIAGAVSVSLSINAAMDYTSTPITDQYSIDGEVQVNITPQSALNKLPITVNRINYSPTEYTTRKLRPRDESILNAVQDLVDKLEASPIQAPAKVKREVKKVVKKAETVSIIQNTERQSNEIQKTMLQIDKLQTIITEHTIKAQKDEADAINALLNIV